MSLTCNAVGDVLALINLAIDIAKFLNECRGAPAECRALCNELRSLERLLALSKPTILALRDEGLRELVKERLQIVSARIEEGLNLIVKFRSAFDVSAAARPDRSWRTTSLRWVTRASQSIDWALRKSTNAKACQVIIAQSFEPLIFSLLVAFQADQKAVLGVLQEAFTDLADDVKASYAGMRDLAVGQETLQADILFLKQAFNQQLMALRSVREEVSNVCTRFADILTATHLDITDVRRRLEQFCSTAVTSADLYSTTQTVVNTVAQESTSTRAMLETFFVTTSNDRLAEYGRFAGMDSKLDQVVKLLVQHAASTSNGDLVKHHRFPGVQQIRVASVRFQELSPVLLPVIENAVISDETLTTTIMLAMTASSSADRVAYEIAAFLLVIARKACQIYKSPIVVHVVFVEDLFGGTLELPVTQCSNSRDFHNALIEKFKSRRELILLVRRRYELQLMQSLLLPQRLPPDWQMPLPPGSRIYMNAYVQTPDSSTDRMTACPACSAPVIISQWSNDWVRCTRHGCPAEVQFSHVTHASVTASENDDRGHQSVDQSLGPNILSQDDAVASNEPEFDEEKAALQLCHRIRVIHLGLSSGYSSAGRGQPNAALVGMNHAATVDTLEESELSTRSLLASPNAFRAAPISQEAFERCMREINRLRGEADLPTWMLDYDLDDVDDFESDDFDAFIWPDDFD